LMLALAPLSRSSRSTCTWPDLAASVSGVLPACAAPAGRVSQRTQPILMHARRAASEARWSSRA
jgi:hypothetical protein